MSFYHVIESFDAAAFQRRIQSIGPSQVEIALAKDRLSLDDLLALLSPRRLLTWNQWPKRPTV